MPPRAARKLLGDVYPNFTMVHLDFDISDLKALHGYQLPLVQYHTEATPDLVERASSLFFKSRGQTAHNGVGRFEDAGVLVEKNMVKGEFDSAVMMREVGVQTTEIVVLEDTPEPFQQSSRLPTGREVSDLSSPPYVPEAGPSNHQRSAPTPSRRSLSPAPRKYSDPKQQANRPLSSVQRETARLSTSIHSREHSRSQSRRSSISLAKSRRMEQTRTERDESLGKINSSRRRSSSRRGNTGGRSESPGRRQSYFSSKDHPRDPLPTPSKRKASSSDRSGSPGSHKRSLSRGDRELSRASSWMAHENGGGERLGSHPAHESAQVPRTAQSPPYTRMKSQPVIERLSSSPDELATLRSNNRAASELLRKNQAEHGKRDDLESGRNQTLASERPPVRSGTRERSQRDLPRKQGSRDRSRDRDHERYSDRSGDRNRSPKGNGNGNSYRPRASGDIRSGNVAAARNRSRDRYRNDTRFAKPQQSRNYDHSRFVDRQRQDSRPDNSRGQNNQDSRGGGSTNTYNQAGKRQRSVDQRDSGRDQRDSGRDSGWGGSSRGVQGNTAGRNEDKRDPGRHSPQQDIHQDGRGEIEVSKNSTQGGQPDERERSYPLQESRQSIPSQPSRSPSTHLPSSPPLSRVSPVKKQLPRPESPRLEARSESPDEIIPVVTPLPPVVLPSKPPTPSPVPQEVDQAFVQPLASTYQSPRAPSLSPQHLQSNITVTVDRNEAELFDDYELGAPAELADSLHVICIAGLPPSVSLKLVMHLLLRPSSADPPPIPAALAWSPPHTDAIGVEESKFALVGYVTKEDANAARRFHSKYLPGTALTSILLILDLDIHPFLWDEIYPDVRATWTEFGRLPRSDERDRDPLDRWNDESSGAHGLSMNYFQELKNLGMLREKRTREEVQMPQRTLEEVPMPSDLFFPADLGALKEVAPVDDYVYFPGDVDGAAGDTRMLKRVKMDLDEAH